MTPEQRAFVISRGRHAVQRRKSEAAKKLIGAGFTHVQRADGTYSIAELALLGNQANPLSDEVSAALNLPEALAPHKDTSHD